MLSFIEKSWHKIAGAHRRNADAPYSAVLDFFVPKFTLGFLLRMLSMALLAFVIFGFILRPCFINGESMSPTFPSRGFTLDWRGKYLFTKPKRGDVVIIRYSDKIYYLKRVVALAGETVEFRNGELYVNGARQQEPYVKYICNWDLPPRTVEPGHYYVVGDNRSQPMERHIFGQVAEQRINGSPLW
ncbi:MAG: signal peptidase I [Victivallaceae bacterium]|nr:signal peptidase I [Victivallaceae bacterium]